MKRLIARIQWELKFIAWVWRTPSLYSPSLHRLGLDKHSRELILQRELRNMPSLAEWMKEKGL